MPTTTTPTNTPQDTTAHTLANIHSVLCKQRRGEFYAQAHIIFTSKDLTLWQGTTQVSKEGGLKYEQTFCSRYNFIFCSEVERSGSFIEDDD